MNSSCAAVNAPKRDISKTSEESHDFGLDDTGQCAPMSVCIVRAFGEDRPRDVAGGPAGRSLAGLWLCIIAEAWSTDLGDVGAGLATIVNSTISGNLAGDGGGIDAEGSLTSLFNVTVTNNRATVFGGGILADNVILINSILSGNVEGAGSVPGDCTGTLDFSGGLLLGTTNHCALVGLGTLVRGDFDGDGHADILWRNTVTGENGLWLMNGPTIVAAYSLPSASPAFEVAGVADFDGDGKADILWRNPVTGENGLWLMDGIVISAAISLPSAAPDWVVVDLGDFNGDLHADIVWENPAAGGVGIWLMNGASVVAAQPLVAGGSPAWQIAAVADFNADGDGCADLFWRNPQTGENGTWLMNGAQIRTAQAVPAAAVGFEIR
jgi:predicted outer membrane repeat protein